MGKESGALQAFRWGSFPGAYVVSIFCSNDKFWRTGNLAVSWRISISENDSLNVRCEKSQTFLKRGAAGGFDPPRFISFGLK